MNLFKFIHKKYPEDVFSRFEHPIRAELYSIAHLEGHGESLAKAQPVFKSSRRGKNLRSRVAENGRVLLASYNAIIEAVREQRAITPAAEWLIDNFHIVEEQLKDIRDHMPPEYYHELPKLSEGPLSGYPRVYGMAWAFIAHTDSLFDPEPLSRFVKAYQKVQPLTIGELWAISITLKVVLIENLRRLSARIVGSQRARKDADKIADTLLGLGGQTMLPPEEVLANLKENPLRGGFAVQLVQRLRFQDAKVAPVLQWLDEQLASHNLVADEMVTAEHSSQTAANATVRNIITSMRLISSFDWQDFFESVSLVDETLRVSPVYDDMDFKTRDRYRHGLEELARRSPHTELEIARAVVSKSKEKSTDPGFYLISEGRPEFERNIKFRIPLQKRIVRWFVSHGSGAYLLAIALLTLTIISVPILLNRNVGFNTFTLTLLILLGLIPASEIAISILHRLLTTFMNPRHLPRLSLLDGVPAHLRTFLVVPTMLLYEKNIDEQVEQLEVHFLSNPDGEVHFALLTDWADAKAEISVEDKKLLDIAEQKIALLNDKYGLAPNGSDRFYLFHRRRLFNPKEGKWIGWERKRGKLHEFNRLLRGAQNTTYILSNDKKSKIPTGVRFVITLDADTKIPKGTVAQLVGTFAHPLNRPYYDEKVGRVTHGYGILQPRITPSLPAKRDSTIYQQISAGPSGVDPYASAVSDVYQDLFNEGSYTGKGIYDLDIFEKSLENRIPENSLLSHDLFEGNFARCALLSDVEFFEDFPSHSEVAASRVHRWIRGDWQLLPWILGRAGTSISLIGRWKMLDNLRRSLTPPSQFLLIIASFCLVIPKGNSWLELSLLSLSLPAMLPFFSNLFSRSKKTWFRKLTTLVDDFITGFRKFLFSLILLAHHAWVCLDAITRALYRITISHKKMLEWTTAAQSKSMASLTLHSFFTRLSGALALTTLSLVTVIHFSASYTLNVIGFFVIWFLAPFFAREISLPPRSVLEKPLSQEDIFLLRNTARKIWRFFSTYVTEQEHFLPPDNFQEDPDPVIAHRSSPTNFGLYLLSVIAARDFGWISLQETVQRLSETLASLQKLPCYQGHFFNWYETTTGNPLEPKYISSVDNGNFAGHLLTVAQGAEELRRKPLFSTASIKGIQDGIRILRQAISELPSDKRNQTLDQSLLISTLDDLENDLVTPLHLITDSLTYSENLERKIDTLSDIIKAFVSERGELENSEVLEWVKLIERDIKSQIKDFHLLTPWVSYFGKALPNDSSIEQTFLREKIESILPLDTPLEEIPARCEKLIEELIIYKKTLSDTQKLSNLALIDTLLETLESSSSACKVVNQKLVAIAKVSRKLFHEMDFKLLYDPSRKLFSIGYRVGENVLDASYYDLLASEARLTSFIAIAKGDVPASHWFRLNRSLRRVDRGAALVSWSGSMFEYLMPSLVMYTPTGSLLEQTCRLVIRSQIQYGLKRNVPWGVSESAYNTRDLHFTYQYSNFGVPELGLKRGLGDDVVIAPYATILAAMYSPFSAVENLKSLTKWGASGIFGFYESIDFTPSRLPEQKKAAVIKAYMAHHQGMSLVALTNVLFKGVMRHRFHTEPIVQATELLLQERTPQNVDVSTTRSKAIEVGHVSEGFQPVSRKYHSPSHPIPNTHLLSNGNYSVMITSAGSGYSRFRDIAVTRWREDVTQDSKGTYIFLRDTGTGKIWSAGHQPTGVAADHYEVVFSEDRARFSRDDGPISSSLEVFLSPEDNAEFRRLTLINKGLESREIEVTSYAEIVLATQDADIAHPAFSNLFVQTEYVPALNTLLATRRPRSQTESPLWMAHVISVSGNATANGIEYETDRSKFLGRGHGIHNPVSIIDGKPLSNTVGNVLDPIVSLRCRIRLEPGGTTHITFATIIASSREEVIHLADKFHDAATFERASTLAWTQAQVRLHYLGIEHDEANLYQQLANRLIYSDPSLRASSDVLKRSQKDVTGLWAYGISGDIPIVLVKIDDPEDRSIIRQLLRAHEYWCTKRLEADLIILNEKSTSYAQELQLTLDAMVKASVISSGQAVASERKGKIFTLRADLLPQADYDLLQSAARAILIAKQGGLAEQVKRAKRKPFKSKTSTLRLGSKELQAIHPNLPVPKLDFYNGLGGFSPDAKEYVIYLAKGQSTPAPWCNVIANSSFGFQVSEKGSGSTWALNSRENQITPWNNDPVSDPSGEAFYIYDKESGKTWCPTASPIRIENSTYVTSHGQGYSRFEHLSHGIYSELLQFVSWTDPVKISKLTLENRSRSTRKLLITAYVEWVLGFSRTTTASHIVTEFDKKSGAIFAYNPWNTEFGRQISFATFSVATEAFTCDRSEFIGRNKNLSEPNALSQDEPLSGKTGAGLDPCAALQTEIEIPPNERVEVLFFLGQTENREVALEIIERYRAQGVNDEFKKVQNEWQLILTKVQVETPDKSMDVMLNRWLLYQTIVCRFWARAAFYQAGGAYGFRDQLQDTMALTLSNPELTRAHILKAAARQFVEGDVQHWWHPPSGRGVRTHFSDDLLWLPFVVSHYLKVSQDVALLDQEVSFIQGPLLAPEQEDSYYTPEISSLSASLYEHCARTLDRSLTVGAHGLPLMGCGDWNDGMNRVGHKGLGESVWLAWFLYLNLVQFSKIAQARGDITRAEVWLKHSEKLKEAVEDTAWDGAWYKRAFFDDGTPLGSASSIECRIDSIAQTWGILSGAADKARAKRAMESVEEFLIKPADDLLLLFAPPFDKTPLDPGYIKGYLPGVRENGGQYSHAAVWCIFAYANLDNGARATELFSMLNPITHGSTRAGVHRYKVEPYVIAADVYSEPPYVGRGGWTWYTGSSGWMYRAGVEAILGFNISGDYLELTPHILPEWPQYKITYRHDRTKSTHYEIKVLNPENATSIIASVEVDGKKLNLPSQKIQLVDDGGKHSIVFTLGLFVSDSVT